VNQTFYKNPLYNAMNDFAPVVLITESPIVLVAARICPRIIYRNSSPMRR
jgi:hypothetical protein